MHIHTQPPRLASPIQAGGRDGAPWPPATSEFIPAVRPGYFYAWRAFQSAPASVRLASPPLLSWVGPFLLSLVAGIPAAAAIQVPHPFLALSPPLSLPSLPRLSLKFPVCAKAKSSLQPRSLSLAPVYPYAPPRSPLFLQRIWWKGVGDPSPRFVVQGRSPGPILKNNPSFALRPFGETVRGWPKEEEVGSI